MQFYNNSYKLQLSIMDRTIICKETEDLSTIINQQNLRHRQNTPRIRIHILLKYIQDILQYRPYVKPQIKSQYTLKGRSSPATMR